MALFSDDDRTELDSKAQALDVGDPLIGRVLDDKYRVIEAIGTGGMGRVYKAIQKPLGRVVALKVLDPNYGKKDPAFQKRFFLEASVTAKLRHPNTVGIYDYGQTDDGTLYIAMEHLEGQTLAQVLKAGPLTVARALNIAEQICRSLREAHRLGIVHRDLKPANVMLLDEETEEDWVKVLDFGLVKPFAPELFVGSTGGAELTRQGMLIGSPMYMAPEQARHIVDPRSDIYSLGVVLYQMLVGRPPFEAKGSIDVIVKHVNDTPPMLRSVRPDLNIPAEVERVVMGCLEKDPSHRYASMNALLTALREISTGAPVKAQQDRMSSVRLPDRTEPTLRRPTRWVGVRESLLLLAGSAAIGLLVMLWLGPKLMKPSRPVPAPTVEPKPELQQPSTPVPSPEAGPGVTPIPTPAMKDPVLFPPKNISAQKKPTNGRKLKNKKLLRNSLAQRSPRGR